MPAWGVITRLVGLVAAILIASRRAACQGLFRWLPAPLWCYVLPAIAVACGWLPRIHPGYRLLTDQWLPVALALLLLSADLPAVIRAGGQALGAAIIGAAGIVAGTSLGVWALQHVLPPEAWKGAGTLAGTWTGGTMNLLALRTILATPERIFAPLILVDAMVAYSWMALLVAASGAQAPVNRWLRAAPMIERRFDSNSNASSRSVSWAMLVTAGVLALGLTEAARLLSVRLPTTIIANSATGWVVLLVTTASIGLSFVPRIRRLAAHGERIGSPCLYVVLAATGAQANLAALRSAPAWLIVGAGAVLLHGVVLLGAGRAFRIPLGVLATASQANIGGVVSAPLVGSVYGQSLVPIGLVLAIAGNAVGTYLGVLSAMLCRVFMGLR
ncbi:MAG: DUF819 family protein [Candidatus Omnitrophica bacterium]|nr:DUF819 family protein [Candidatus Omnitrophota bacterium]